MRNAAIVLGMILSATGWAQSGTTGGTTGSGYQTGSSPGSSSTTTTTGDKKDKNKDYNNDQTYQGTGTTTTGDRDTTTATGTGTQKDRDTMQRDTMGTFDEGRDLMTTADESNTQLFTAMKDGRLSFDQAIKASEKEGRPVAGKFDVDSGKLQAKVYTMKGDEYREVTIDQKNKIVKTDRVSGEDLEAVKHSAHALSMTNLSLRDVASKAKKDHPGYQIAAITPMLNAGTPEASVHLVKGTDHMKVAEPLTTGKFNKSNKGFDNKKDTTRDYDTTKSNDTTKTPAGDSTYRP